MSPDRSSVHKGGQPDHKKRFLRLAVNPHRKRVHYCHLLFNFPLGWRTHRHASMMDPLSITVGVVGLLSSLTTLSIRINEFQKDFSESSTEIQQLTREVSDLTQLSVPMGTI
jgi:hypothetical protein